VQLPELTVRSVEGASQVIDFPRLAIAPSLPLVARSAMGDSLTVAARTGEIVTV